METHERGECPACGGAGPVGEPCPQRACSRAGLHHIPAVYAARADEQHRDPLLGRRISRWLLVDRVGHGATSRVFRALDLPAGETAALKVLDLEGEEAPDSPVLAAVQTDAQALQALRHPNVARLLAHGTGDTGTWLASEFIEGGQPLGAWIRDRYRTGHSFAADEIRELVGQALDGIEAAHALGLVHQDVTPGNLLIQVARGGMVRVRVIDFAVGRREGLRRIGSGREGTAEYLAPEQIRRLAVGPWTDLYSLGVIVHLLATGTQPFPGDAYAEIFRQKVEGRADPVRSLAEADWPDALVGFLRTALATDPGARFRTAAAFRAAFLEAMEALRAEEHAASVRSNLVDLGAARSNGHVVLDLAPAPAAARDPDAPAPAPIPLRPLPRRETPAEERDRLRREALRAWLERRRDGKHEG